MNVEQVVSITREFTEVYRKREEVERRDVGNVHVVEVFGYPHYTETPDERLVDMTFIWVRVKPGAEEQRDALIAAIGDGPLPASQALMSEGPSYLHLGADLGSQELALRFMALGKGIGLWSIFTAKDVGMDDEESVRLAGLGWLYAMGYNAGKVLV